MNQQFSEQLSQAATFLREADAVLIGAGAGLSVAAGVDFTDQTYFAKEYPGMLQYGFRCKLDLMGVSDLPQELSWGYYLPHVKEVRFSAAQPGVYRQLLQLAKRVGTYFVQTTNADGLFERNGFAPERIFTPQGDYARYQCLTPCTTETWATEPLFAQYLPLIDKRTQKLPKGRYPACPRCGGPTFLNVRGGDWFVEEPHATGFQHYQAWLKEHAHKRLVVLDIGSGFNTPMWIRWPSEKLVRSHERARLIRINLHHPEVPSDLAERSVSFRAGADTIIDALLRNAAATPLLRKEGGAASVSR